MFIVASVIAKVLLITLFGWYLRRRDYLDERSFDFLNRFLVDFASTFLIFSSIVANHTLILNNRVSFFIFFSVAVFLLGYLLGELFHRKQWQVKPELQGLVAFQNCGYLPLNIAVFLLSGFAREYFLVFIFIYLLGFNFLIWSVGSFLIFKKSGESFDMRSLLLPPVVGTILGLVLVYLRLAAYIPAVIVDPMRMIGDTTPALAALALGGWLAMVELKGFKEKAAPLLTAAFLRLILVPLIFFIIVVLMHWYSLLGLFVVLIAAMPSAVTMPVIAKLRGADTAFVSQGVFITHVIGIVTIPLWLGLFLKIAHFRL